MKNLVLTSTLNYDKKIDEFIKKHQKHKDPILTIIPAFTEFDCYKNIYLSYDNSVYKQYGIKRENIKIFDVCFFFEKDKIEELLNSDIIILGGGNTFLFRFLLSRNKMFDVIRKYVQNGGILIGKSAGSIMMSNDIEIAGFADEDIVGGDVSSLALVDFEVKPHFDFWHKKLPLFLKYSKDRNSKLYCLYENSFIIVEDESVNPYGDYFLIDRGNFLY